MAVKIMIDAGHYGKYNKSPVNPQYYESEMTWKLQQFLKVALEEYSFEVGTTRDKQSVDLEVGLRGQKSKGYDLLLSLHSNACVSEKVDRVCAIYLVDDKSGIAKISAELAQKLAVGVAKLMRTKDAPKWYERKAATDRNADGILNDNYYGILNGARSVNTAAIILEHSFHTNLQATKWLMVDSNLKKLATMEADILADFYGMKKIEPKPAPSPAPAPAPKEDKPVAVFKTLKKGSKGADVKAMQILLIGYGYNVGASGADGAFGANTEKAVIKYQADNKLPVDGSVGPEIWYKLLGL